MGRKKKEPEKVEPEEPILKCCATCSQSEETDEKNRLYCRDFEEKVSRMDSCGDGWKSSGGVSQTEATESTTQFQESGAAPDSLELVEPKKCGICGYAVDSANSTAETPVVFCQEKEIDIPPEDLACEKWCEPHTCGNCAYRNDGGDAIGPWCILDVVETELFDPQCPACDQWKPLEEALPKDQEINRSETGYGIQAEMPGIRPTADFNLYAIKDFEHELNVALFEVYKYLATNGSGDPTIAIKLSGFQERIKASIVVTLPNTIKYSAGSIEIVRENGTFRIVLPDQRDLFEKPSQPQQVQSSEVQEPEPDLEMTTDETPVEEAISEEIERQESATTATDESTEQPEASETA